jgi:hypothetical protein
MLRKLRDILNYYDSEPIEILLGITWLIFFPLIWLFQFGFHDILVIVSIMLGASLLKISCGATLSVRKTLAYGSSIFSVIVVLLLFLNDGIGVPSNWLWFLPIIMSIMNLTTVTSKYYRKHNKDNGRV